MSEPYYLKRKPGDFIVAKDWNDMQLSIREHIKIHTHSGDDNGTKITGDGINPDATVTLKDLTITTKELKVNGKEILAELADMMAKIESLDTGKVSKAGDTIKGSLIIEGNLGIGTTKPNAKLSINAGKATGLYIETENEGPWSLQIRNKTASQRGLEILQYDNGTSCIWANYDAGALIAMTPTGNVGIGTTGPAATLDVNGWIHMKGRKGYYASGNVPGDGNWHNILSKLNGHQGYEVIAAIGKSGLHGLTHAIALNTFMGAGETGDHINKTRAYFGGPNGRIDIRWTGTTYNSNLQLRTMANYGGPVITYNVTKLW